MEHESLVRDVSASSLRSPQPINSSVMIVCIYLPFVTTQAALMYILAKLRAGEVGPPCKRGPHRSFRPTPTPPSAACSSLWRVKQLKLHHYDAILRVVLLPFRCGVGIVLCQMSSNVATISCRLVWQGFISRGRVLPDTHRQAINQPTQFALAVCASPSRW
ncbi:hypothetical protein EV401DRAFT_1517646 [Pisolithus croceorrhizus]|nr:hypothetical protein EV401DRAFT_1517646 [Pisolithus croceorrhizus]